MLISQRFFFLRKQIEKWKMELLNLINEDEFGISTRIELIQFKNWIFKIVNLGTNSLYLE